MSYTYNSIGFIGLGAMGFPMAENLIKKLPSSTNLYVFDVSKEALERIAKGNEGRVHSCADSREVADKAEIVLTMVPEGSHVRSVYLTPETGVLAADLSSKLLIDCSTIDTETSDKVRSEILEAYPTASFYDAPVSGGVLGAQKASLTIMLGCKEDDPNLGILQDLLGMMGSSIFPCGGPSLGLTAKLCNNYCSGLISIATAEAFNIGMRSGMDPRVLANIFSTSTAQSCVGSKWNPVPGICPEAPASHGYKNGFKVQLMKKDFGLAVETAERVGAKLMLGEAGLATYAQASEDPRCKDLDSRVIYRYIGGDEEWESSLRKSERK